MTRVNHLCSGGFSSSHTLCPATFTLHHFFPEKLGSGELPIQQPTKLFSFYANWPQTGQQGRGDASLFSHPMPRSMASSKSPSIPAALQIQAAHLQVNYGPAQAVRHSHFSYREQPGKGVLKGGSTWKFKWSQALGLPSFSWLTNPRTT